MINILDQVAKSRFRAGHGHISPQTPAEFFALRLADKLGDLPAAQHYIELVQQRSECQLLAAYRRAVASDEPSKLDRRFHVELERIRGQMGSYINATRLCAIRIERRAIAIAILAGDHLEYVESRQLATSADKATATARGFIAKIMATFPFESAAIDELPSGEEIQRAIIQRTAIQTLTEGGIGLWSGPKDNVLRAYRHPAPTARKDVRAIISNIYPVLGEQPGRPWTQDAAALGLYVQTERIFNQ